MNLGSTIQPEASLEPLVAGRENTLFMNISIHSLQDQSRFKLLHKLEHTDLIKFVQQNLLKINVITIAYLFSNILIWLYTGFSLYLDTKSSIIDPMEVFAGLGLGFFLTFFVAFIIHENIHLLAYRILGAKKTSIRIQIRQLVFLALADKFVLNRNEFYFLAILPFSLITGCLLILLLLLNPYYSYVVMGILILHTGGCSGDFALVSFFMQIEIKI